MGRGTSSPRLPKLYTIVNKMKRAFLKNPALYLLTLANIVYAVKHGFSWPTYLAIALSAASFVMEVKYGKK